MNFKTQAALAGVLLSLGSAGCMSPYRSDQGALIGGLGGAGVGALVGNAVGNPLAGAAVGAAAGGLSGAMIGGSLDEIEARNRAEIEARLGRPVAVGGATIEDVIAMTRAGVSEEVILTHVHTHGTARVLQTADLIYLQNNGVSPRVVQAMQGPPRTVAQHAVAPPPPPMVVHEYVYDPWYPPPPPWWGPPRYRRYPPPPSFGVGIMIDGRRRR